MKRIHILMFVLVVTGFVHGDAVTREQDPLTVNSKTIMLKLENSRVRVLEATLKPGDKEKTHSHPAYVIYVIEGGKVRNHGTDPDRLDVIRWMRRNDQVSSRLRGK